MARWLLPDERTAIFACILPSSLSKSAMLRQQRQRAHAGEVAAQRVSRMAGRGIDGQFAAGLAAIGAEIGELRLQHAARQRGVDRGRREMRLADVELGRGNPRLRVDIVQAGEVDRWRCSRAARAATAASALRRRERRAAGNRDRV